MKKVMYHGMEISISTDTKAALQSFRNYCVLEHERKFKGCEDLKGHDDILGSLCAREEAFRFTQNYDEGIKVIDTDDWYVIMWESEAQ